MKVWVDLSNSPHPLLFDPISRELERRGHDVRVTARDNAQTVTLARERWDEVAVVGGESPRGRLAKARVLARRVDALRRWASRRRFDVALSHNSYAQVVAARALGVPVVTAMDFEHQPANHLAFRLADRILLPAALAGSGHVRRQGATRAKTRFYPGLKEEVYLGDFRPRETVLDALGVDRATGDVVVVVRTPPTRALYHAAGSRVFADALRAAAAQEAVRLVVLARFPEQRAEIRSWGLPRCATPDAVVDARSAMYGADVVVGAGGTMTREAALLGIPAISVFAGRRPRVDLALEARGLLRHVSRAGELGVLERRRSEPTPVDALRARSRQLVAWFATAAESAGCSSAARD